MQENNDLRIAINTSNESQKKIWLLEEVAFEIWYGKNGEIDILKNDYSGIFIRLKPDLA